MEAELHYTLAKAVRRPDIGVAQLVAAQKAWGVEALKYLISTTLI